MSIGNRDLSSVIDRNRFAHRSPAAVEGMLKTFFHVQAEPAVLDVSVALVVAPHPKPNRASHLGILLCRIGHVGARHQAFGIVPSPILRRRAGSASVFPFGLRWQAILGPILSTEPIAKRFRVFPAHDRHRMFILVRLVPRRLPGLARVALVGAGRIFGRRKGRLRGRLMARGIDELSKLLDGDFVLPDVERPRDFNLVAGNFILEIRGKLVWEVPLFNLFRR